MRAWRERALMHRNGHPVGAGEGAAAGVPPCAGARGPEEMSG